MIYSNQLRLSSIFTSFCNLLEPFFFSAICQFPAKSEHHLPLELGDLVQLKEAYGGITFMITIVYFEQ